MHARKFAVHGTKDSFGNDSGTFDKIQETLLKI